MFVTDSLFTLEFCVDKLTISPGVVCRFPAVAFRFLDFPTITLHLLEEHQRDRLRAKLTIDPEFQIPDQIKDYQDKSGYYEFNSGKSCLYRLAPDTLRSLLAQVPLYIIIADGFTQTPTLVGSAMLPLAEPMEQVYEMLLKDGISVPASSGMRSSLTVYNLMGHPIGQVIVGCRLSSLGMALLSHLPQKSVASYHQYKAGVFMPAFTQPPTLEPQAMGCADEHNISAVLNDIANEQAAVKFPIIHREKSPPAESKSGSAEDGRAPAVSVKQKFTQTKQKRKEADDTDEGIELIVPDVYCPPPLYYNKMSIPQSTIPLQQSLDVSDVSSQTSSTGSCQSKGEVNVTPHKSEFGKPPPELLAAQANKENIDANFSQHGAPSSAPLPSQLADVFGARATSASASLAGFPLLKAIVSELVKFGELSNSQPPSPKVTSTPIKSAATFSASRIKENLSPESPPKGRQADAPPLLAHGVTKNTKPSDVSKKPSTSKTLPKPPRKRPLIYGYTTTQKLRLSKTNPNLLRQIEESEEQAKLKKASISLANDASGQKSTKLRLPKGKRKEGPRSFRSYTSQQPLDISTEMGRLTVELAEVKRELAAQKAAQMTPRMNSLQEPSLHAEMGVTRILTPRMSKIISPRPSQQTPRRSMSALSNRNSRDELSTLHEHSIQSDSRRSLEIHLPTPALEDTEAPLSHSGSQSTQQDADEDGEMRTGSQRDDSLYHSTQEGGDYSKTEATADMADEYSMVFSPEVGDSSASPLGHYRDSYGSDSFISEDRN